MLQEIFGQNSYPLKKDLYRAADEEKNAKKKNKYIISNYFGNTCLTILKKKSNFERKKNTKK